MRTRSPRVALATLLALAGLLAALVPPSSALADHSDDSIHPGVMTLTAGGQCTSNFVFRSAGRTFLGQAAHCSGTGAATDTNGCDAGSRPLGTEVEVDGATRPGTLVYSSWIAMQRNGETDPDACAYNDFALVEIDPADAANVSPTVPGFGGPTGLGGSEAALGDTVFSYGNSSLRQGIAQLRPKQGTVVSSEGNGWSRTVYTVTPGIPGDSGSGFLSADGAAIGTLSTLALAPTPASNGVADLRKELAYANRHGGLGEVSLVEGDEPFDPNLLGAILE